MDRGSWWAIVHGVAESNRTEQLTLSLYTKWITNKDLLYSTGNYTQYVAIACKGKQSEIYIYIYIKLNHFTPETNTL